jgi:hypothetical protein
VTNTLSHNAGFDQSAVEEEEEEERRILFRRGVPRGRETKGQRRAEIKRQRDIQMRLSKRMCDVTKVGYCN